MTMMNQSPESPCDFALRHHGSQKYGRYPYLVHLDEVAHIVNPYGNDAVTIAYLHDVIEDTDATHEELKKQYGNYIADSVALISDEKGENRKIRKARTFAKLKAASNVHSRTS